MKRIITLAALVVFGAIYSPAEAQISVRSQLSHDENVIPGAQYSGVIMVRNDTEEVQQAKVYQTDYLFQSDGSNYFGDPGNLDRSNANWIEVGVSQVMIPPRESVEITYRVNVPASINDSAPSGSYWSVIMVEGIPKNSPESLENELPDNSYGFRSLVMACKSPHTLKTPRVQSSPSPNRSSHALTWVKRLRVSPSRTLAMLLYALTCGWSSTQLTAQRLGAWMARKAVSTPVPL